MDMRVGQRERAVLIGAMGALVLGFAVWFWLQPPIAGEVVLIHRWLITIWIAMAAVFQRSESGMTQLCCASDPAPQMNRLTR